ncbi:type IV toxin-antitoxin system AbiEi family antitoxin [Corynebacterium sp. AOP40-9SA-29]|uniref:type IV toxin-antitoxin system AbiEi family antitoxin n=1 Tax=Corynebacterium sp. AOP40-9SA-29 TaxID=3457677 RepID=UPI0040348EE8
MDVDSILRRLRENTGLAVSPVEGTGQARNAATSTCLEFQLPGGGGTHLAQLQVMPQLRSPDLARLDHARKGGIYTLVVADRVTPMIGDQLREIGYWFVDRSGNAFLSGPGLYVDIRGRQERIRKQVRPRPQPQNLFTPRRSQVICMLLTEASLARAPLRKIARESGTSLAIAKGTMDLLVQSKYMETTSRERWIVEPQLLLDAWASSFRSGLGRDLLLMTASRSDRDFAVPAGFGADISGEQAVPELIRNPETLTVYLDANDRGRVPVPVLVENRWRQDDRGEVTVRRRFWSSEYSGEGIGRPPLPLVYADLLDIDDPRLHEVAVTVKEQVLDGFR